MAGEKTPKDAPGERSWEDRGEMDEALQRRIATNEALFREVNEAIERGVWHGEEAAAAAFRCECARLECNQLVSIAPRDYEHVRGHPRRFVVLPGHEQGEVEVVVDSTDDYLVVEKRDEAGRLADASDPRS
jgi:hypothetical protein